VRGLDGDDGPVRPIHGPIYRPHPALPQNVQEGVPTFVPEDTADELVAPVARDYGPADESAPVLGTHVSRARLGGGRTAAARTDFYFEVVGQAPLGPESRGV
jgi:hypothetical protein